MTPFKGTNRVTSPFGQRKSPITGRWEQHKGMDVTTGGSWPGDSWTVRECTGGRVVRVSWDRWRGNYLDVETSPEVIERYQHLHEIFVKVGELVPQGASLAMAGKSGDSTGVHLHFEVQKKGVAINPSLWCGIANATGSFPGNDQLDAPSAAGSPPQFYLIVGPATAGDKNHILGQALSLGLPCIIKEDTDWRP